MHVCVATQVRLHLDVKFLTEIKSRVQSARCLESVFHPFPFAKNMYNNEAKKKKREREKKSHVGKWRCKINGLCRNLQQFRQAIHKFYCSDRA